MLPAIRKYPRTRHVEGSRLQPGDAPGVVPWSEVRGRHLVVEEKVDGANSAISFGPGGRLLLQSRGHYLTGGAREKHFAPLKTWAQAHAEALFDLLGERYVMYGEWLYAKHTVYYDALPHYFLEFDILDRETDTYLSTARRRELIASWSRRRASSSSSSSPRGGPEIVSVPVLHEGPLRSLEDLVALVGPSAFKTPRWRERLAADVEALGLDVARAISETDASHEMEGLYVKIEESTHVVERLKWVRQSFLTAVLDSESHWLSRPIVPNRLAGDVSFDALFSPSGARS